MLTKLLLVNAGTLLPTANEALGPAAPAKCPFKSTPVLAPIEIPIDPSPVILEMVTVWVELLPLVTVTVPVAGPVVFSVTSVVAKVLLEKLSSTYVMVYVTGPEFVAVEDGPLIDTVGAKSELTVNLIFVASEVLKAPLRLGPRLV